MSSSLIKSDLKDQGESAFSAEEYLERIGWYEGEEAGKRGEAPELTFETVVRLQQLHATSIPFDNLDFHLEGAEPTADPRAVWPRVAARRRGTYCFQGNGLFAQALHLLGFSAALVGLSTWRGYARSFFPLPSHCGVLVDLGQHRLAFADVATVDSVDGVLDLARPFSEVQTAANGVRYRFQLLPDDTLPYVVDGALEAGVDALDLECGFDSLCRRTPHLSVAMLKEDVCRDPITMDPIEPLTMEWVNRFGFRLPTLPSSSSAGCTVEAADTLGIRSFVQFPHSLPWRVCDLLARTTAMDDTRSFHYKQWVAIRLSRAEKRIVSGFRYILTSRPFSARTVTRCAPDSANQGLPVEDPSVVHEAFLKIRAILEREIGLFLTEDEISRLKIEFNFTHPKVEFVWAY